MVEMVEARRNGDKVEERHDLFSGLLDAAQDEPDIGAGLSDEELIGWYSTLQLFIILEKHLTFPPRKHVHLSYCRTRGWIFPVLHAVSPQSISPQTTAHTLCFTFALLALYPDEQERLYQHIKEVMSGLNRMPVGSRNLNSVCYLTSPVDLRGYGPLHSIIGVSPLNVFR